LLNVDTRIKDLQFVQLKRAALTISMPVKQDEHAKNRDVPGAEDDHQHRHLIDAVNHKGFNATRQMNAASPSREQADQKGEEKLQRIDVKQNHKQQNRIEANREIVLQSITAKEFILIEPDHEQQGEADSERAKTAHGLHQLAKGFGNFQRHNQQRDREPENGIAKALGARDLMTAPAKLLVVANAFVD